MQSYLKKSDFGNKLKKNNNEDFIKLEGIFYILAKDIAVFGNKIEPWKFEVLTL